MCVITRVGVEPVTGYAPFFGSAAPLFLALSSPSLVMLFRVFYAAVWFGVITRVGVEPVTGYAPLSGLTSTSTKRCGTSSPPTASHGVRRSTARSSTTAGRDARRCRCHQSAHRCVCDRRTRQHPRHRRFRRHVARADCAARCQRLGGQHTRSHRASRRTAGAPRPLAARDRGSCATTSEAERALASRPSCILDVISHSHRDRWAHADRSCDRPCPSLRRERERAA